MIFQLKQPTGHAIKIFLFAQPGQQSPGYRMLNTGYWIQDTGGARCSGCGAKSEAEVDAPLSMLAQIVCHAVQILRAVALLCGIMRDLFSVCCCGCV